MILDFQIYISKLLCYPEKKFITVTIQFFSKSTLIPIHNRREMVITFIFLNLYHLTSNI